MVQPNSTESRPRQPGHSDDRLVSGCRMGQHVCHPGGGHNRIRVGVQNPHLSRRGVALTRGHEVECCTDSLGARVADGLRCVVGYEHMWEPGQRSVGSAEGVVGAVVPDDRDGHVSHCSGSQCLLQADPDAAQTGRDPEGLVSGRHNYDDVHESTGVANAHAFSSICAAVFWEMSRMKCSSR